MKLNINLLKKFIELPTSDSHKLRTLFDDCGLEVDDIEEDQGQLVFNIETLAHGGTIYPH